MKTKTTQWGRLCIMILIVVFAVVPHDAADISFDGDFLGQLHGRPCGYPWRVAHGAYAAIRG